MRIIAGVNRGRILQTLKGMHTRPTSDRVKEAVFSSISPRLYGALVLDAFAGSAALGLEALSRGAAQAVFVEADRQAAAVCEKNIALFGQGKAVLHRGDCLQLLPRWRKQGQTDCFDIIFADPPYNRGLLNELLKVVADGNWLSEQGMLVAETVARDSEFDPDERWQVIKTAVYGNTRVIYCRLQSL